MYVSVIYVYCMLLSKLKLKAIQNRKAGRDLSRPAHFGLKRKQAKQMKFNYKGKAMVNVELRILVQILYLCCVDLTCTGWWA